ncbi:hypothetical protein DFJ74DRAFT_758526 [Hyaloraphidium curvatum]|nr:hypothetical protein DFJ74DRAFT_758526 [Hyaloraphidium curvatum]
MASNPFDDPRLRPLILKYEKERGFRTGIFREAFEIAVSHCGLRVNFGSTPPEIVIEGVFEPEKGDDCLDYTRVFDKSLYDLDPETKILRLRGAYYFGDTMQDMEGRDKSKQDYLEEAIEKAGDNYKVFARQNRDRRQRSMIEIAEIALGKILHSDCPYPILNKSCFGVLWHEQLREWEHEGVELDLVLDLGTAPPLYMAKKEVLEYADLASVAHMSNSAAIQVSKWNTSFADFFFDLDSAHFKTQAGKMSRAELLAREKLVKDFAIAERKRILVFAGDHGPLSIITKPPVFLDSLHLAYVIRLSNEVFGLGVTRYDFGSFGHHNDEVKIALNSLHDLKKTSLVAAKEYLKSLPAEKLDLKETYVHVVDKVLARFAPELKARAEAVNAAMAKERARAEKKKGVVRGPPNERVEPVYRAELSSGLAPEVVAKIKELDSRGVLKVGENAPDSGASGAAAEAIATPSADPRRDVDSEMADNPQPARQAVTAKTGVKIFPLVEEEIARQTEIKAVADKGFATFLDRKLAASTPHYNALTDAERDGLRLSLAKKEMSDLERYKIVKHYVAGTITTEQLLTMSDKKLIQIARHSSYLEGEGAEKSMKLLLGYDAIVSPDMTRELGELLADTNVWQRCTRFLFDGNVLPLVVNQRQLEALVAREVIRTPEDVHSAAIAQIVGLEVLQAKANYTKLGRDTKGKNDEEAERTKRNAAMGISFAQTIPNRIRKYAEVFFGIQSVQSKRKPTAVERNKSGNSSDLNMYCFFEVGEDPGFEDIGAFEAVEVLDYDRLAM